MRVYIESRQKKTRLPAPEVCSVVVIVSKVVLILNGIVTKMKKLRGKIGTPFLFPGNFKVQQVPPIKLT